MHDIGNVPVYEYFPRVDTKNIICRYPAVGAAYPEVAGRLLLGHAPEE